MNLRIFKKPRAQSDLEDIAEFIAEDSPNAAERFLLAAQQAFDALAEMPGLGRERREFLNPKLEGLRSRLIPGFENYMIFYQVGADRIEIIRILHGARDLGSIIEAE